MAPKAFLEWLLHETSLYSLFAQGTRDIYIILLSRFLRMYAFGGCALVLGIFLWTAGNKGTQIGTFMTLTLLGDAAISYMLTILADNIGRRRVLMIGSFLMVLAGTVFAFSKNYWLLLFAAIFGVISPGAHEVGPFRAIEVSGCLSCHLVCAVASEGYILTLVGIHARPAYDNRRPHGRLRLVCRHLYTRNVGWAVCQRLDNLHPPYLLRVELEGWLSSHLWCLCCSGPRQSMLDPHALRSLRARL